mmetsp:Transcript_13092/g.50031  ORF Transcript_13092/g.50031 Transcript_13092/m.50031 type:complete len:224 (-) Transcript_13092:435-1106(-)
MLEWCRPATWPASLPSPPPPLPSIGSGTSLCRRCHTEPRRLGRPPCPAGGHGCSATLSGTAGLSQRRPDDALGVQALSAGREAGPSLAPPPCPLVASLLRPLLARWAPGRLPRRRPTRRGWCRRQVLRLRLRLVLPVARRAGCNHATRTATQWGALTPRMAAARPRASALRWRTAECPTRTLMLLSTQWAWREARPSGTLVATQGASPRLRACHRQGGLLRWT